MIFGPNTYRPTLKSFDIGYYWSPLRLDGGGAKLGSISSYASDVIVLKRFEFRKKYRSTGSARARWVAFNCGKWLKFFLSESYYAMCSKAVSL